MTVLIAGVDVETTGLLAAEHRIIEAHVSLWTPAGVKLKERTWRIHPRRSIAIEAQRVHGISIADLEHAPDWEVVAPEIHKWLSIANLIVGHNGKEFDLPFLNMEFERVGMERILTPVCDTMLQGRWSTPTGAVPNLGALCFACGVDYDPAKAHAASYDVDVMMDCFFKAVRWGWIKHEVLDEASKAVAA